MTHRYLEFAAGTAIACVAATVLATAQTPAQTPAARPEDGRAVTAVGCLKQERDIHGRTTTPQEAGRPADGFVLLNARITSASMPDAPKDPPGEAGAGTSGTGNTNAQATERRPREGAQGGATAANPAPVRGPETMYKIVGLPDAELTPLLGKEVEVRATLDANTMGTAALRQPGTTMGREPANTPSASSPPPAPTQAPATEADRQEARPVTTTLPELKATSIKATGGRCQGT